MITNYPVGDFIARIKNAALADVKEVRVGKTKLVKAVAQALKREGFLSEVKEDGGKVVVNLAYAKKEPILIDIILVSKPGLRIYETVEEIESKKGPEIYIISTPKGVLSSNEAIKKNVGGEVIAKVL
jgi:small subunit ribosomal protein S8